MSCAEENDVWLGSSSTSTPIIVSPARPRTASAAAAFGDVAARRTTTRARALMAIAAAVPAAATPPAAGRGRARGGAGGADRIGPRSMVGPEVAERPTGGGSRAAAHRADVRAGDRLRRGGRGRDRRNGPGPRGGPRGPRHRGGALRPSA